ncbi:predicted protein [Aspergillus terreus NIH2624]|uniref:Xylanolytic transcriptional activator regulatory domain-containing protein n=1 Tax=Aspergillus terreus (strain NIH 2624 / FGSC A1156) TaxID=341663 RepID=Q0D1M4_ASPTN|nr:uncharacterized protein ATEG_00160 [Aspergillus terreus NIH2624]EAU38806.1 predicted protein [Aspergillus terreus NIH2624]
MSQEEIEMPDSLYSKLTEQHAPQLENTESLSNSINAMGAAVPDVCDIQSRDEYYGQSSLVAFIQQCAPVSTSTSGPRPPSRSTQPISPSTASTAPSQSSFGSRKMHSYLSDDYSLPPRQAADWLVEIYFTTSHMFYPWVHKESFMRRYEQLWSSHDPKNLHELPDVGLGGRGCSTEVFYCGLNAIFAIACEFSNMPVQSKRSSSLLFYERMKSLLNIDIFDSGSLAHIQALLLVSLYLQCTPYPRRCWNTVGMAYRISVGIGLHLSRSSNKFKPLEREIRWRVWCACVQMDICLSAGTEPDAQSEADAISHNQFLYENMRLIGILGKLLSTVYHSTEPGTDKGHLQPPSWDAQAIMDIERDLENFQSSLHPGLHWDPSQAWTRPIEPIFKRQSNTLHARYLHLKLLLYRPGFSGHRSGILSARDRAQHQKPEASSWSRLYQRRCAEGCVQAACDLIESLSKATVQDATGAWWYGVFYLISAGIVLVSVDAINTEFDGVGSNELDRAWERCLQTLLRMVDVYPSARDYAVALNGLKQHVLGVGQNASRAAEHTGSDSIRDSTSRVSMQQAVPTATSDTNCNNVASYTGFSPLLADWDFGLEDIMLPQCLQEVDEGLLPNLS